MNESTTGRSDFLQMLVSQRVVGQIHVCRFPFNSKSGHMTPLSISNHQEAHHFSLCPYSSLTKINIY